jgi:hypothetical protein
MSVEDALALRNSNGNKAANAMKAVAQGESTNELDRFTKPEQRNEFIRGMARQAAVAVADTGAKKFNRYIEGKINTAAWKLIPVTNNEYLNAANQIFRQEMYNAIGSATKLFTPKANCRESKDVFNMFGASLSMTAGRLGPNLSVQEGVSKVGTWLSR